MMAGNACGVVLDLYLPVGRIMVMMLNIGNLIIQVNNSACMVRISQLDKSQLLVGASIEMCT